jgi:hypothetical protein
MNSLDCGQNEYAFANTQFQNSCKYILVKQLQVIMNVCLARRACKRSFLLLTMLALAFLCSIHSTVIS